MASGERQTGRLTGFDGVRGIAALSVLCSHVLLYGVPDDPQGRPLRLVSWLELGVVLFFSLSGFLLYRGFAAVILGLRPAVDVRDYAIGRFLRIVPAYWAALAIVAPVASAALVHGPGGHHDVDDLRHAPGVFLANLFLVQNYLPATTITGIGPAWTLAVEVAFYMALPFLSLPAIALARRWGGSSSGGLARVALALAPPTILLLLGIAMAETARAFPTIAHPDWSDNWQTVLMRSFVLSGGLFATGMFATVVVLLVGRGGLVLPRGSRTAGLALAVAGIVIVVVSHDRGFVPDEFFWLAASVPSGLLLFHLALTSDARRSPAASVLETRGLVYAGVVSYSVYLWHEPLIRWLGSHGLTFDGRWAYVANVCVVGALTLAIASVSYYWVERPAMSLRKHAKSRSKPPDQAPAPGRATLERPAG